MEGKKSIPTILLLFIVNYLVWWQCKNAVERGWLCAQTLTELVYFKAYQLAICIHQPGANLSIQQWTLGEEHRQTQGPAQRACFTL